MITREQTERFTNNWIAAWNNHDLEEIMTHYAEDVEYFSPFIAELLGDDEGMIKGKSAVREYLRKGLEKYPDLQFKLEKAYGGVASITIQYITVNDMPAAEVFELNESGLARRVQCHIG